MQGAYWYMDAYINILLLLLLTYIIIYNTPISYNTTFCTGIV